jgi:hypothetical protein
VLSSSLSHQGMHGMRLNFRIGVSNKHFFDDLLRFFRVCKIREGCRSRIGFVFPKQQHRPAPRHVIFPESFSIVGCECWCLSLFRPGPGARTTHTTTRRTCVVTRYPWKSVTPLVSITCSSSAGLTSSFDEVAHEYCLYTINYMPFSPDSA